MAPQSLRQDEEYFPDQAIEPAQGPGSELIWDCRYRSIIGQLNLMLDLLRREPGRDLTPELDRLVTATLNQIDPEDRFLELVEFPGAREHRLRHQFICVNTAKLRYRVGKGRCVLPNELEYLRLLWLEHIQVHDRSFEDFLLS
jgi:hemerythrin